MFLTTTIGAPISISSPTATVTPTFVSYQSPLDLNKAAREYHYDRYDSDDEEELPSNDAMDIVNDPARAEPVRIVVRALAEAGRPAGMGLSIENGQIVFFHRWCQLRATKPL